MKPVYFVSIGLAALACVGAVAQQTISKASVGETSPAWSLSDSNGKTQALEAYKGKYVVLEWTNKDCPFVKKHYESGNMQSTQEKAKELGAVWLTVISSAPGNQGYLKPEGINSYREQLKVKSTATLLDPEGKVGKLYDAKTTPQIVVIDPEGKVIYNGAIDDRPTPDKADIPGSKNYALSALTEAMAGKKVSVPTSKPYGCGVKYAQ